MIQFTVFENSNQINYKKNYYERNNNHPRHVNRLYWYTSLFRGLDKYHFYGIGQK